MIEAERQISEAPDICVIVLGNPATRKVIVLRFEDENGITIAEPNTIEFGDIMRDYSDEILAVCDDLEEEMDIFKSR